ncbi:MAG TPA: hypothetical protein VI699_09705 [Candidatus Acidoferrales bacterium]|nr:hypothetical protein [Candidatus Acidoferrales bacterium]
MGNDKVLEIEKSAPAWVAPAVVVAVLLAVVGAWFGWSASSQLHETRQAMSTEMKQADQNLAREVAELRQQVAVSDKANAELQSDLGVVAKRLNVTQGQWKKAREEAARLQTENAKQLAAMDTAVKSELATKASAEEVKAVSSEVSVVRTDLNSTIENLKMARGELGTLIARNSEEVSVLRRLGERDYLEFTIEGKQPQKVGAITVQLRGTNTKKSQFTVAMTVDDLRVEKKNRQVNEPIYFYTRGGRQPLELVINKVDKNKVAGYLSIPKAIQVATASSGK